MPGAFRGVAVSNTSVVLANRNLDRTAILFGCGDSTNAGSVILKDVDDATTTNGFPLEHGCWLLVEGVAARSRWSAIRLAAVDSIVGVREVFLETLEKPPEEGVPV